MFEFALNDPISIFDDKGGIPTGPNGAVLLNAIINHLFNRDDNGTSPAFNGYLFGTPNTTHVYGPEHPWTGQMKNHPRVQQILGRIGSLIPFHCLGALDIRGKYFNAYSLNRLSTLGNVKIFIKDGFSYAGFGTRAHSTGSFNLDYTINSVDCDNCTANVDFHLYDRLRLGSNTRVLGQNIELLPDIPLRGVPFNTVFLHWKWNATVGRPPR